MLKEIAYEAGIPMEHIGRIFGLMNKMEKFNNENIIPEKIEIMPGGLTNNNYKVTAAGITYAVRVAGRGTEEFINRPAEKYNAGLMSKMGINAPLIYYDETTGCQVCKYLDEAITYTPDSFHSAANVKKAVDIFKQCHTSGIVLKWSMMTLYTLPIARASLHDGFAAFWVFLYNLFTGRLYG